MSHALNPANEMVNALLTHGLPDYSDMKVFKMTLAYDLRNIISLLSASNIKLILQSYPASWANDILKETANVNKIAFVDNQAVFEKMQAASGYKREDYFAEDGHCNAEGYKVMAENIYNMRIRK
jgi:lysophospholipase L1-like esterase